MFKTVKYIIFLLIIGLFFISCDSAEDRPDPDPPKKEALKFKIVNDSENLIDKVYFHYNYNDYKNEKYLINSSSLEHRGDSFYYCPSSRRYITYRRELSKIDNRKIYVTSSIPLNFKKGIITIELGDADFFISIAHNPYEYCSAEYEKCDDIVCDDGKVCDTQDGICKTIECDPICTSNEYCDSSSRICKNSCDILNCEDNQYCNIDLGKCSNICETITCEDNQYCDTKDGVCKKEIESIVELRKMGSTFSKNGVIKGVSLTKKLEGIITATYEREDKVLALFISQEGAFEYAGIYIPLDNLPTISPKPAIGDIVKVKGDHYEFYGASQIIPLVANDFEIIGKGVLPEPIKISVDLFEEKYEGMLIELENSPFLVTSEFNLTIEPKRYDTELEDKFKQPFKMKSALFFPYYNLPTGTSLNNIIGILEYENQIYKIFPRDMNDLE